MLEQLAELKRIQIGVAEDESQANGLAGESFRFSAVVPTDRAVERISEHRWAAVEFITWYRMTIGVLNLDADVAGRRAGEIERQLWARELQRSSDQFAAVQRSVYGYEAVESQCIAADRISFAVPRSFAGVE